MIFSQRRFGEKTVVTGRLRLKGMAGSVKDVEGSLASPIRNERATNPELSGPQSGDVLMCFAYYLHEWLSSATAW